MRVTVFLGFLQVVPPRDARLEGSTNKQTCGSFPWDAGLDGGRERVLPCVEVSGLSSARLQHAGQFLGRAVRRRQVITYLPRVSRN